MYLHVSKIKGTLLERLGEVFIDGVIFANAF